MPKLSNEEMIHATAAAIRATGTTAEGLEDALHRADVMTLMILRRQLCFQVENAEDSGKDEQALELLYKAQDELGRLWARRRS